MEKSSNNSDNPKILKRRALGQLINYHLLICKAAKDYKEIASKMLPPYWGYLKQ